MKRATKDSEGWRAAAARASLPDVDQGIIKHPRSSTDVAFVGDDWVAPIRTPLLDRR